MAKGKSIAGRLFCFLLLFIVLSIAALMLVANYMVNISIGRGAESSGNIQKTLAVSTDKEQMALESKAEALKKELHKQALSWGNEHLSEKVKITSEDNLSLNGYVFMQVQNSSFEPEHRWAVIIHGYGGRAQSFWDFARVYYEAGFNVLTPDLRAAGESDGNYIGMGWLDRRDLISWLNEILRRDESAEILVHGFSMGAATIMMASGEVDFPAAVRICVEDSGYSSDWDELADKLHQIYKLPSFPLLHAVSLFTKLKAGYSVKEADCVPQLQKNKTPMLFIHGDADDYNPFRMLDVVYNAAACEKKEKLVVHGARHVMSAYVDRNTYWHTVWAFIEANWQS